MKMMRKGQLHAMEKGDVLGQIPFVATHFGIAA